MAHTFILFIIKMVSQTPPEVEYSFRVFNNWNEAVGHNMDTLEGKHQNSQKYDSKDSRDENRDKNKNKVNKRGRKGVLIEVQMTTLRKMVENPNPPTQKAMAERLGTTENVIRYQIKKNLSKKLVKKPKGHYLTPTIIEEEKTILAILS
jgi:hypothetical protein